MLRQSEAAYCLRRALGPLQCWEDLLADFRGGKREQYLGLILLPYGVLKGKPVYRAGDVSAFIKDVLARGPLVSTDRLDAFDVDRLSPDATAVPWRMRRLTRSEPGLPSA